MKIALDAGHGYNTAGKRIPDGSMREWEFNNAVAFEVARLLAGYENVQTIFTHDTTGKTDVPLINRTNAAKAFGADALVSIHANAFGNGWNDAAHGTETFTYTEVCNGAGTLAANVQAELVAANGLSDRGVKKDNLHMVREARKQMASILVENAFMTNHNEAALLKTAAFRSKCARGIANGIAKTYGLRARVVVINKPVGVAPTTEGTHTVRTGDTLWGIATGNGLTVDQLRSFNAGKDLDPLQVGEVLKLAAPVAHAQQKRYVHLPSSEPTWRVYPLSKPCKVGNEVGKLAPSRYGGLTYEILADRGVLYGEHWVFEISSPAFGRVKLYAEPTITGATTFFK
jgi:N-acetylmuramoyl-L-alanine amidase